MRYLLCSALIFAHSLSICDAFAAAELRFDSSGFFAPASGRSNSSSTLTIHPDIEASGGGVTGKLDVQFSTFLDDANSYAWEVRDTYLTTSKELFPLHQLSVGRRHYDWLKLDEIWQVGLLSPRFQWDPLHPQTLGLSGLFYEYRHRAWRVLAFASPISIPEHGYPIQERDNRLHSASPLWKPPLGSMPVMNQEVPIHYSLDYPSTDELVLHAGVAVSARYQDKTGPEGSLTFASLPIHQPDLVTESQLVPTGAISTTIRPRILRHTLVTGEIGYREPETRVWGSFTVESPQPKPNGDLEVSRSVGPTLLGAFGVGLFQQSRFRLGVAYLSVRENKIDAIEAALLPSRYNYSQATRLSLDWKPTPRFIGWANWTHDLDWASDLISLDLAFRPSVRSFDQKEVGWVFGLGIDLIPATRGGGFIGQYESDDRIRGRVSYAF